MCAQGPEFKPFQMRPIVLSTLLTQRLSLGYKKTFEYVEECLQSVAFETSDTGHPCRTDNIGGGNPFEAIVFPYIRED